MIIMFAVLADTKMNHKEEQNLLQPILLLLRLIPEPILMTITVAR